MHETPHVDRLQLELETPLQQNELGQNQQRRDESLVVTVTLPGCSSRDAKLDVSETHLRLYAPAPPQNGRAREYRLNAPLSRRVRSEEARAKWSKKLSALVVTIPVVGSGGGKE